METEEPEQRRQRLQALRSVAVLQDSTPSPSSASHTPSAHLSNPLANPQPPTSGSAESTPARPRFDFYTDPMAAYSGSKQRSGGGGRGGFNQPENFASPIHSHSPTSLSSSNQSSVGPRNYHLVSPAHQFQMNQYPDQSPYGNPQHAPQSTQWRNLVQFASPEQSPYGTPPRHPPQSSQWRAPIPFGSPFSGPGATLPSNSSPWNRSGGSSGHGFPSGSSRGSHMSPNYGRGGSPMNNSGRGSPMNYSGRGNYWQSGSRSPGHSRGRGGHGYGQGSSHQRIEKSYKAMLKDPWRKLKPVIGSILVPLATNWLPNSVAAKKAKMEESGTQVKSELSHTEWLPKSLSTKKAKTEESESQFSSQSSLAECLALSFQETINEAE